MTKEISITDGNKLIAEFMGAEKVSGKTAYENTFYEFPKSGDTSRLKVQPESMKYHSSWDWLLPCLQKAKEEIKKQGWGVPLERCAKQRLEAALNEVYNLNIKNAHFCFIKFIEWYNSNQSK